MAAATIIAPVLMGFDHNLAVFFSGVGTLIDPRNLMTVAAALTVGAGDLTLKFGNFTMGGIGTAAFAAIILYQILAFDRSNE